MLSSGAYFLFSYHLICDGFHPTVTTEYVLTSASSHSVLSLSEEDLRKSFVADIGNGKELDISLDDFDASRIQSDSEMDKRCAEHMHMISRIIILKSMLIL